MTCGLVHASYSLPKWQPVKLTSFAPCLISSVEYGKPSCTSVVIIYSENSIIVGPLLVSTL